MAITTYLPNRQHFLYASAALAGCGIVLTVAHFQQNFEQKRSIFPYPDSHPLLVAPGVPWKAGDGTTKTGYFLMCGNQPPASRIWCPNSHSACGSCYSYK